MDLPLLRRDAITTDDCAGRGDRGLSSAAALPFAVRMIDTSRNSFMYLFQVQGKQDLFRVDLST